MNSEAHMPRISLAPAVQPSSKPHFSLASVSPSAFFRAPWSLALVLGVSLAGCTVGPDYVRPDAPLSAQFKEAQGWKSAQPADQLPKGNWWEIFGDPVLNDLEAQIDINNQNVRQAEALYRQAQAQAQGARAAYFPTVSASLGDSRGRTVTGKGVTTQHSLSLDASWEADLWGGIRRSVEAGTATAQASAATLANAKLSAQATLAQDYFLLRVAEEQKRLYERTVAAYTRSLELTRNQYAVGVATRADVVQAETQLKSTQALALDVEITRGQLEHAIALLIGKAPGEFSLAPASLVHQLPDLPLSLPSALLERRPDIASAERQVAAANAQIGVAQAAWFPSLSLTASGGYQSATLANWISAPNRFWSLGPTLAETLFDGGARSAKVSGARAAYDAAVAAYRQTVLGALGEVEDNLVALRILKDEIQVQNAAVASARESVTLTTNQYKAGTVSYLNVVTVETTALTNERSALTLLGRQYTAAVLLIKALGGGWDGQLNPVADAATPQPKQGG